MADLTQTAANVHPGSNAIPLLVQYGDSGIAPGMPLYLSSTKYYIADANDATKYAAVVVALTYGDADEYGVVQKTGSLNVGATTVKGEVYVLSATAGKWAPASDLTSGWYPVTLGVATDTVGNVTLGILATDAVRA